MASLAEMERLLMVERTQAGLRAAREQGRIGRNRIMAEAKIRPARKLLNQGTPPREVASGLGVSVPTLYRWRTGNRHRRGFKAVGPPGWGSRLLKTTATGFSTAARFSPKRTAREAILDSKPSRIPLFARTVYVAEVEDSPFGALARDEDVS